MSIVKRAKRVFSAKTALWDSAAGFIEEQLSALGCSAEDVTLVLVAAEEIFVNVATYAYPDSEGELVIDSAADRSCKKITLSFSDTGIPHDPLSGTDPNVTLSAGERSVGGLGIFLVKRIMDTAFYQHTENENVLTVEKTFK